MSAPVLITGVGKRAGYALAERLLHNDVAVIGTYRSDYPELSRLRDLGAVLYPVDFYQPQQTDALIDALLQRCSRLRAIVHNASDWLPDNHDSGLAEVLSRMMAIHVETPLRLNKALTPLLQAMAPERADIIHITDYVAATGSRKHMAYAASKAALTNLTQSFAAALAPAIKVNAIAPALLRFNDRDSDAYRHRALSKALIPREGGFDELLAAVEYLMASDYITGRVLPLDGGRHLRGV
ncbi:dihydromonapterin reductase [Motiliproteus sediminis]|uniref:dihydromonapterin reductase n=1 Tax=Motiliproteus sediminis TaxID=1468178 RepID=UPI001AEF7AD6|nr:dihydromonapterin reductase [Motiliproteus sediminis]